MSQAEDELETLLSIFSSDEITISRGELNSNTRKWIEIIENSDEKPKDILDGNYVNSLKLTFDVYPRTELEEVKKVFVFAKISFFLPIQDYPNVVPVIEIDRSKGLDDDQIQDLIHKLNQKAHEILGEVMIFSLLELARDIMTENNKPQGNCSVCLEPLDQEEYMKTKCYHFFHVNCLRESVNFFINVSSEKKLEMAAKSINISGDLTEEEREKATLCPFCRSPLGKDDIQELEESATSNKTKVKDHLQDDGDSFKIPDEIKEMRARMEQIYNNQLQKGGIIDIELNQRRFLVDSDTVLIIPPPTPTPVPTANTNTEDKSQPNHTKKSNETQPRNHSTDSNKKKSHHHHHHHHHHHPKNQEQPGQKNEHVERKKQEKKTSS